ncbi:MAG TPA: hypothetical protein VNE39_16540 [Planctomycetota bacterium]|nr:hypothetical protein [Planctomycetota bacterium]
MKPIRLSGHARGYMAKRGFTLAAVERAIRERPWQAAEYGEDRLQASMEFPFRAIWNGRYYAVKRVRPIFVELELEILVITVYTYYY